jgi:hypothetical protein
MTIYSEQAVMESVVKHSFMGGRSMAMIKNAVICGVYALSAALGVSQVHAQVGGTVVTAATDPGWEMQVLRRAIFAKSESGPPQGSEFARIHEAYCRGLPSWRAEDGTEQTYADVGFRLSCRDWVTQEAVPASRSAQNRPVLTKREPYGTRFTLPPINVTDDLLCSISFVVIDKTPENAKAVALDYLATSVELFGGVAVNPSTSEALTETTHVDFWNSRKHKRYTITRWKERTMGHVTVQTYGPLLFDVIDSPPDFMFIDNEKIALSPQFQHGCRELCDKVLEQRRNQGQMDPPRCRVP